MSYFRACSFRSYVVFTLLFAATVASMTVTEATCEICDPNVSECSVFLASLRVRTALAIITTTLITSIFAAWQSTGSGHCGFFNGVGRTFLQAFAPEAAYLKSSRVGFAMHPEFKPKFDHLRKQFKCHQPTKAQIVAVSLKLLAVRDRPGTQLQDHASLFLHVHRNRGLGKIQFCEGIQRGYREVTLEEAVLLPDLFFGLPKGRTTIWGLPAPQVSMALLWIQAVYYITCVVMRTTQGLYTTVVEWYFVPSSCTFLALGVASLLWEPAWSDIAHLDIDLGGPIQHDFPWI